MRSLLIKYKWMLCMLALLPFISGCNEADDVQKIFTGKTWKLTYITKKNEHGWYKFSDVTESIYQSYDPQNGTRSFKIEFTGSTDDDLISGDFTGSGSISINGTWRANGTNNDFSTTVKKSSLTDSKDTLGKKIIEGITKATSYGGDENNLYLYFDYKDSAQHDTETLCLVFAPAR